MKAVDQCENCGRAIGKLEQPYVWRKHIVCAECHVHLSTPAPAAAAVRPAQAPPPLPPREHFHARPGGPKRQGPPPAPVALQREAPAPQAAPMLLCTACGHAYAFGDVVSDHGKVICRNCALAAAAHNARTAARDQRNTLIKRLTIAAAAVVVIGVGAMGTYHLIRSRPDRSMVAVTGATPRAGDAMAEEIMAGAIRPPAAAQSIPAPESAAAETSPAATGTLFPPADFSPADTADGRLSAARAPAAPAKAAIRSPTPAPEGVSALPEAPPAQQRPAPPLPVPSPAQPPSGVAPGKEPGSDLTRSPAQGGPKGAAPAVAPAPRPAPPPPEDTAAWHVYKGRELLAQAKYPQALEQFNAAMRKDRDLPDAWHGAGLCNQNMGDRKAALDRLEKAVTLYEPPSRAAVYNCAVANLRENPMRAAKIAREYLSREGAERDEPMHTLMGRALFSVNRQGRLNKVWVEAQAFYFAYNEQLESARTDGRKRWGGEWVPGRDATEKWNRYRSRRQNVESLRTAVDRATKAKKDAWDKLYDQRTGMRLIGDREQREGRQRYEQAARQEINVRQQFKAADAEFRSAEKPPFPQLIKFVPMDPAPPPSPGLTAR